MTEQPGQGTIPEWDVADRMRKALRESGVAVEEMASYLDVSRQSVGNWLGGRVSPSRQTLRLWALRTGVSFDWLAGDYRRPRRVPSHSFTAGVHTSVTCRDLRLAA